MKKLIIIILALSLSMAYADVPLVSVGTNGVYVLGISLSRGADRAVSEEGLAEMFNLDPEASKAFGVGVVIFGAIMIASGVYIYLSSQGRVEK